MKSLKRNNSYVLLLTPDLLLHDIAKEAAEGATSLEYRWYPNEWHHRDKVEIG